MSKYKYVIVVALLVVFAVALSFTKKEEKVYEYQKESITTALFSEGIEFNESDYVTNDNQVKVYLFRGSGCSHCYEFLTFVNDDLIKKYKKKVTFEIYEVWNNKDNSHLMQLVSNFRKDGATGVPYIIVGDQSWLGYREDYGEEIKAKIDEEYAKEVNERYDVLTEMSKAE